MKDAARSKSSSLIDRCLREARQLLGVELDRTDRRKNLEASRSAIKRYSYGIGDDNPLWCNEVYARQTRYGGLIAPPSFLFSVDDTAFNQPRIPGLSLLHAEDEMEFLRPIFRDDQITSSCKIIDVEEKRGRRVPRMVKIVGELKYFDPNDSDRVFATILATKLRVPHAGEEGGLNYEKRQPHQYSQTEFEAIRRDVFEEERRGATPRYWEDVRPGDEMKPVIGKMFDLVTK